MWTSWRDKPLHRLTLNAFFLALGMIFSYVEYLIPLTAWIPLPGFRPGLCNLAVMLAFFLLSPLEGVGISLCRILLSGLLFGSATSLWFSLLGGVCSLTMLFLCRFVWKRFSFLGTSVLSAAAHNCGQILAAASLFGFESVRSYLPVLLLASVLYGGILGLLSNRLAPICAKILAKGVIK